ncbi:MAG TPA: GNVR domain-containing protein, partial [Usitatibacter sp.]|nr:GNVR domain-containing protein [Usitatibacter sp.]
REKVAFMRENGLGLGIEKEKFEVQKLADLEERIADTRAKIAAAQASLHEVERQIRDEPATRTTTTSFEVNALRETTKAKRLELQTALVVARTRYREDSPEVRDLAANIAGLDAIIAQTAERVPRTSTEAVNAAREDLRTRENGLRSELAGHKAALGAMERRGRELRTRISALPALEVRLAHFERDWKFAQEKYLNLVGKRAQASVSMAGLRAMPSMRVVSRAVRPDSKQWPKNVLLYPMALAFGLALGLGIALAKSVIQGRIRRDQLAMGQGPAPFYGLVDVPTSSPRISVVMPERLAPPASG